MPKAGAAKLIARDNRNKQDERRTKVRSKKKTLKTDKEFLRRIKGKQKSANSVDGLNYI
jgi:hypothetical protein